jgi:hypothetical protein
MYFADFIAEPIVHRHDLFLRGRRAGRHGDGKDAELTDLSSKSTQKNKNVGCAICLYLQFHNLEVSALKLREQ